jgi:acyl dehydratase
MEREQKRAVAEYYFEDYVPGDVYEGGTIHVDGEEMIEFAKRFDPQVFHVDPERARETIYGGLIASGWFTCALTMRLFAEQYVSRAASLGSPGIDELRWLLPVRPDDDLTLRVTVQRARESRTKSDRGIVHSFAEVFNQRSEVVMTMQVINLFLRRSAI